MAGAFYGAEPRTGASAGGVDIGRPHALAVIPAGEVAICDPNRASVIVVGVDGQLRVITDPPMRRPTGLAASRFGRLYVADSSAHRVLRLRIK